MPHSSALLCISIADLTTKHVATTFQTTAELHHLQVPLVLTLKEASRYSA